MLLIKNASVVNEGSVAVKDVLIDGERISRIDNSIDAGQYPNAEILEAKGLYLFPGAIDDQVHFREPGLTHKADIFTESRAAVAGGITSFMEMPNTIPNALTQELLEEKYKKASETSLANYSFYMGVSNDNAEEVLKTDPETVCGVKIFMGSSTGNMLVDKAETLEKIFSESSLLIATHCEDEHTIKTNLEKYKTEFGDKLDATFHPKIRSTEACYLSSSFAVELAKKFNSRLHVLHISSGKELGLFNNNVPLKEKRITAEACIHHLWFTDEDYSSKGNLIKWNPAVKSISDRDAIRRAVTDDIIDVVATDHAPHTLEEKMQPYLNAPSGGPLVQHALLAMLEFHHKGWMPLSHIAKKMSHDVADCFRIKERGFIREGYYADLVLVDINSSTMIDNNSLLYKCKWSPFEGYEFGSTIRKTLVNGKVVFDSGNIIESGIGKRMKFEKIR